MQALHTDIYFIYIPKTAEAILIGEFKHLELKCLRVPEFYYSRRTRELVLKVCEGYTSMCVCVHSEVEHSHLTV